MSKHTQQTLRTLAAGFVLLGLSACSTSPINPDSSLGHATAKMAEVGSRAWVRTKHVFRADGTGKQALPHSLEGTVVADGSLETSDEFLDEVDLALADDEFPMSEDTYAADNILVTATDADNALEIQIEEPVAVAALEIEPSVEEVTGTEQIISDYEHVVQENETLWILSKQLTGDATNWRILAELNGLDENGSVFPGQTLHIPADLATGNGIPALAAALPADSTRLEVPMQAGVAEDATKTQAVETVTEIIVADSTPAANVPTTAFEVQAGETMWDLAKRTTGDATNWKSIASANDMTEQDAAFIKYGQKVGVPTDLLKSADNNVAVAEATPAVEAAVEETVAEIDTSVAETIVVSAAAPTGDEALTTDGDVKIVPANFTSEPPLLTDAKPTDIALEPEASAEPAQTNTGNSEFVMVSGTYYPKAIYNDANFSAPLLMRVSPGTKLEVVRSIGPWLEVKTDRGVGFVHSRDIK